MVIVKLQGGLGNQMFQYAAAAGLNKGKIYADVSFLKKHNRSSATFTARRFQLWIFPKLKMSPASKLVSKILSSGKAVYRILKKALFPKAITITDGTEKPVNNYTGYKTVYLDGYFQNENNFKHIREKLLSCFEFPALKSAALVWSEKIKADDNSVSVHVRRSDYLKPDINAFHGVLPVSYYHDAKGIIENKITRPHYYIFSDDPEWCAVNFSFLGNSTQIVNNTAEPWEDMCLMSQCNHHIIANSSYSWWGAWLNKKNNKVVIAPQKWFAEQATDIVPTEWIKV
jgi:hypothetical protein